VKPAIPSLIVPSVQPEPLSAAQVAREFLRRLADGAKLRPAGTTKRNPRRLLNAGYTPKHKIRLFDTTFYLTNVRQNEDIRFFVGYLVQDGASGAGKTIHPRIFYKDVSLIWRSASHFVRSNSENWIGKGDVRVYVVDGEELIASDESTTDLPLEIQDAFESLIRRPGRVPKDEKALGLVLRRGHDARIQAYRDFTGPRQRAQANPRNLVNRGRSIARFTRKNDPTSLRFVAGFEPDFARGVLAVSTGSSRMYGGKVRRFRILSKNRKLQYLFMAGPKHVWIIPPQALTTELSSYGVRTIDVVADDNLCIPAFEYHLDSEDDGASPLIDQIPPGFAGAVNEVDPSRSDASAWIDRMPVVREFRRKLLRKARS
jgi:hypothetical protein